MRVLVVAFACHPERGSEPGAGWAAAAGAARGGLDVVLVTQPRHRDGIERARRADPGLAARLEVVYVGLPARLMDAWDRLAGLKGLQVYYYLWQVPLARTARRLHRRDPFDAAHHVTLSNDWIPTGLSWVPQLAVVWGPLGGGEQVPAVCRRWLGWRGRAGEVARRLLADPLRAVAARTSGARSALLVAQNREVADLLRATGQPVVIQPNADFAVALVPEGVEAAVGPGDRDAGARTAVFAGRLLAWKGVHLAVATVARPELAGWTLHVYGDGPERRRLEDAIAARGLVGRVVLHGRQPRDQVLAAMAAADVFFYPSLRDASPWVVAEAETLGCPVVCVDVGGPPIILGGRARAVPPGPDLPAALAQELVRAAAAPRPSGRPEPLDVGRLFAGWYREVADGQAGRAGPLGAVRP